MKFRRKRHTDAAAAVIIAQETAIKDRIQERLGRQAGKGIAGGLMQQPVAAA